MTALVATTDGLRATVRSVRWSPLLLAPVASAIALVAVRTIAHVDSMRIAFLGDAGLVFTAVVVAFVADDAILSGAAPTPIEARTRLAARALVAVPVTVAGWLAVLAVYWRVLPGPAQPGIGSIALASLGVAATALALATLFARSPAVASPGAAGVAGMVVVGIILQAAPVAWLEHLPAHRTMWVATILVALPLIIAATREPARS